MKLAEMNATKPDQIKRIIVRGTNWVGDAMMTVPALRELLPRSDIAATKGNIR